MIPARLPAVVLATLTITVTAGLVAFPAPARAGQDFTVVRPARAGDRFATSASIARLAFPDGVAEAFLVNGDDPVDALAASAVAGPDVPILYTHRDTAPDEVRAALDDLGVEDVYAVGGRAVISEAVVDSLTTPTRTVSRLSGEDRYETAYLLATWAADLADTPPTTVILVRGDQLADALSAAPYAARTGTPMLLTASDHLPDATWAGLDDILGRVGTLKVVGGPSAVHDDVVEEAADLGDGFVRPVERWFGADRYDTSKFIAQLRWWETPQTTVGLANGVSLVDALPGAVLLAQSQAPVLLTRPDGLGPAASEFLTNTAGTLKRAYALGGTGAVPVGVVDAARQIVLAPPLKLTSVYPSPTSLRLTPETRDDYRFTVHLAPAQRDTTGRTDAYGFFPTPATWPGDAREVPFVATEPDGGMRITGLTAGTRYDVWVSRTVADLPPTTTGFPVVLPYSPPVIRSADVRGNRLTVVVDAPPADGRVFVYLTTALANPDGTYREPRPALLDPQGTIDYAAPERTAVAEGSPGRTPVEVTFTDLPTGRYDLWAATGTSVQLGQGDPGRQSTWSYWNSANSASQVTYAPAPTAASVTVG